MNEPLPYLVEHGVLVWQLALAAFVVAGAFFGRKIPHAWAARDARRWREAQGEAEQIIADGPHTLVGTLALDAEGAPVSGLTLTGSMVHPDTMLDCALSFEADRPGLYRAALACDTGGRWRVRAINNGDAPFAVEYELLLP